MLKIYRNCVRTRHTPTPPACDGWERDVKIHQTRNKYNQEDIQRAMPKEYRNMMAKGSPNDGLTWQQCYFCLFFVGLFLFVF